MKISSHKELQISQEHENLFTKKSCKYHKNLKISSHKELQISQEHENLFTQRAANITRIFLKKDSLWEDH
jgi:hypothetical protein